MDIMAMRNGKGTVKKIKTTRKSATKLLKIREEGSTTILYGVGISMPK